MTTKTITREMVYELSEALDPQHQGECWPDPIAWDGRALDVQARDLVALARATVFGSPYPESASTTRLERALEAAEKGLRKARRHRHRAKTTSKERCWSGCVVCDCPSEAAHGAIVYEEICSCGAQRSVEVNGCHRNMSEWYVPEGGR